MKISLMIITIIVCFTFNSRKQLSRQADQVQGPLAGHHPSYTCVQWLMASPARLLLWPPRCCWTFSYPQIAIFLMQRLIDGWMVQKKSLKSWEWQIGLLRHTTYLHLLSTVIPNCLQQRKGMGVTTGVHWRAMSCTEASA